MSVKLTTEEQYQSWLATTKQSIIEVILEEGYEIEMSYSKTACLLVVIKEQKIMSFIGDNDYQVLVRMYKQLGRADNDIRYPH